MQTAHLKSESPHAYKIYPEHRRGATFTAYPGWRIRFGEDGTVYHERIENFILRWFDIAKRKLLK